MAELEQHYPLGAHVLAPRTIQIAREEEEATRPPYEAIVTGVELVSRYSTDLHAPIIRELDYSLQCACCGAVARRPEAHLSLAPARSEGKQFIRVVQFPDMARSDIEEFIDQQIELRRQRRERNETNVEQSEDNRDPDGSGRPT